MLVVLVGRLQLPDCVPLLSLEPVWIRLHDGGGDAGADVVAPGCRGGPDAQRRPTRDGEFIEITIGLFGPVPQPANHPGRAGPVRRLAGEWLHRRSLRPSGWCSDRTRQQRPERDMRVRATPFHPARRSRTRRCPCARAPSSPRTNLSSSLALAAAMPIVRNELKPVPTPASTRPGNISSRVAIALAVDADMTRSGWVTPVASAMRVVLARQAASVTKISRQISWESITHTLSNPSRSASWTCCTSVGIGWVPHNAIPRLGLRRATEARSPRMFQPFKSGLAASLHTGSTIPASGRLVVGHGL